MADTPNLPVENQPISLGPMFPERVFTPMQLDPVVSNPKTGLQHVGNTVDNRPDELKKLDALRLDTNPLRSISSSTQYFKPAEVNFDRYVNHPRFKELGFYPYVDNETYYNKNSTLWDDVSRAAPQMMTLAGIGFTAGFRSMGNLLSGNPSFDDTELSDEFGNAIAIGQSTRGGLGAWTNNFLLNSSYSVGIIGELAVEEAALGLAGFGTGGSSWAAGALRLGQAGKQLKSAWRAIDSASAARDFYTAVKTGGSGLARMLAPNTVTWAKGIRSADNLKDFATLSRGFGDFYRDVRTINLTLDESNMEGGFAYTETLDNNIRAKRLENGGKDLTAAEYDKAAQLASEAAFATRMTNIPLIYVTNQLTFNNAFRGFGKYLSETDAVLKAGGKSLYRKTAKEIAEEGEGALGNIFRVEDMSFFKDIKNPRKWGSLGFRYAKGNLSEGIQELGQEFVQGAAVDYYSTIYADKNLRDYYGTVLGDELIGAQNILSDSILKSAKNNVFSGQGFDTFLQGFLTGGLIGGGTRLTTTIMDKTINKKEAQEKAKAIEELAVTLNEATLSTKDYIDFLNKENLVVQKEAHFEMNKAEAEGDKKGMLDAKENAIRNNLYRLIKSGNDKYFKEYLTSLKDLSVEEADKIFKSGEKGLEEIDQVLNSLEEIRKTHEDVEGRFGSPYNPKKYDPDKENDLYIQELANYFAWEEDKKKIVFAKDAAIKTAQRMQGIVDRFREKGPISDATYSDYSVMFSEKERKKELDLLAQEIKGLESNENLTDEQKELLRGKKARLDALDYFQSNLEALRANAEKKRGKYKGKLNKKEYQSLFKQYAKYLNTLGGVDEQAAKDSFEDLVDYYLLSDEAAEISTAINNLIDPAQMSNRTERLSAVFKDIFNNRKKYFEESVKKYVNQVEKNQLIANLAAIGVQPDLDSGYTVDGVFFSEYDMFMLTGAMLKSFVSENGPVIPGTELYKKVQELISEYLNNTVNQENKEVSPEAEAAAETAAEPLSNLDKQDFEAQPSLVTKNAEDDTFAFASTIMPYLQDVMMRVYRDQSVQREAAGAPSISFNAWINSKQGRALHDVLLSLQERYITESASKDIPVDQESEQEFKNWISQNRNTPFVVDSLLSVGLSLDHLTKRYRDRGIFDKSKLGEGESLETAAAPVNGIFVVSSTKDDVKSYKVVDFENRNVLNTEDQEVAFTSLQDAVDQQREYGKKNADTSNTFVFDGTVFNTGEIWNNGIRNYTILSKPSEIAEGKRLKVMDEDGRERTLAKARTLLPGKVTDEKDPNRSYLLSTDKYNSVHAHRNANESRQEAQERLSSILANTPKEELLSKLTVVVKQNPNYDPSKKSYLIIEGKAANPYIMEKSPKMIIEIQYDGKTIGYLDTLQDVDFLNADGKIISAKEIDTQLFGEMSNLPGSLYDNFRRFKKNLYHGYLLWKNAEELLRESGGEQVVLTGEQIQESLGNLLVARSEYVYGDATINELAFNQLDGGYFVIERRLSKSKGSIGESRRYITQGYTSEQQEALQKEVEALESSFSGLGRYVLATRQPNGNIAFVELIIPSLSEGEVTTILSDLKARARFTKDNTEAFVDDRTETNDAFNAQLVDKMFIALPTTGLYVVPSLNERGEFVISIARDFKGKNVNFEKVVVDPSTIESVEDLVNIVNETLQDAKEAKKIKFSGSITRDSFKAALGQDVTITDILSSNFKTNVAPQIVGRTSLRALGTEIDSPASTQLQDSAAEIVASSIPVKKAQAPAEVQPETPSVETKEDILSRMSAEQPATEEAENVLSLEQQKDIAWRNAYNEAIAGGATKVDATKIADKDSKVVALQNEISSIRDGAEEYGAWKQVDGFTPEDESSIAEFLDFVKKNLPDYFVVEQLETLEKNLRTGVITLGKFYTSVKAIADGIDVNGVIQVSAVSSFKYHEAFHGLFRLLLNEPQIKKLLASAKREKLAQLKNQGKTLEQAILEMKATNPEHYAKFTQAQLEDILYEEYLADAFESWKKNKSFPTDSAHKNFFARLIELIRMILGLANRNSIVNLFRDFNAGKYAKSPIANNRFTKDFTNSSANTEAFKQIMARPRIVVEYDKDGNPVARKFSRFFSGSAAINLMSDIAAMANLRASKENKSTLDVIDDIIDNYRYLYNLRIPEIEEMYIERFGADFNSIREQIMDIEFILSEKKEELKEAINKYMNSAGFIERVFDEENEEIADDEGNQQEEIKISQRGGMAGLSSFVRTYISTITRNSVDQFGNTEFEDGTPMIQSVDVGHVYNGLLNALAGQVDQKTAISRMAKYAEGNPDTEAFVDTFFSDTGISIEDGVVTGPTKNADLFQKIMKGFEQFSINYKFIGYDKGKGEALVYDANRKDRSFVQLTLWKQFYDTRGAESKKRGAIAIGKLINILKSPDKVNNQLEALSIIKEIAENTGIHFHPAYISYSIAVAAVAEDVATPAQIASAESFGDIEPITTVDLAEIQRNLTDNVDPFVQVFSESESSEEAGEIEGSLSRLKKLASANAFFDESISATSWKNSEGETVWNHQYSTYTILATELLKIQIAKGEITDPYLRNNLLLSNPKFTDPENLSNLKVERIDGLAIRFLTKDAEGNATEASKELEINRQEGKVFGSMAPEEFVASALILGSQVKIKTYMKDGMITPFGTMYHIPSILEASSTSQVVSLPVVKYFNEKGKLTAEGRIAIRSEIYREFEGIKRARKEAATGIDLIAGYHYSVKQGDVPRGFKFDRMAPYMDEALIAHLEAAIENNPDVTVENAMATYEGDKNVSDRAFELLIQEADNFVDVLVGMKGLFRGQTKSGETLSIVQGSFVPKAFEVGHGDNNIHSGFTGNAGSKTATLKQNLHQFYINDLFNSFAFNQLIKGEQKRNIKNSIDEVKRNKGEIAGGHSAYTETIAPNLGINHATTEMALFTIKDPVFIAKYLSALFGTEKSKERADAQMWISTKSFRHLKFGFGELDENFARLLDKIDQGIELTDEEIFGSNGMIERGTMLNSIKVVYYKPTGDGKYIKTSAFVLTKQLTSVKNSEGTWAPLAGYEELHNLREAMERYENENQALTALVPESASKLAKQNVKQNLGDLIASMGSTQASPDVLDMRMMWLQQKNPSNKLMITDPTQNKQIINVDLDSRATVLIDGKSVNIGEISKRYDALSAARFEFNYAVKEGKILKNNKVDLAEVYRYAQETLAASGRAAQAEYFELDELGQVKYDHNNPVIQPVFIEMLLSYLSKGVLQEKVPGHTLTLVSDFGFNVVREVTGGKAKVVRRRRLSKNPNLNSVALVASNVSEEEYNINSVKGSKDGNLVIDRLRFNVQEVDDNGRATGRRYAEILLPAHFRELMTKFSDGEIPAAISEMLGIRIPTQDKHSALYLKVVDFLPAEYGSVVVAPRELIEISGADFDIDKLYVLIKEWYVKKNENNENVVVEYKNNFEDFVHYTFTNNKEFRKMFSEIVSEKSKDLRKELNTFVTTGKFENAPAVEEILKTLGLPVTKAEFDKASKNSNTPIYLGALNNAIHTVKTYLHSNPGTTEGELPPAYQPADISPLTDLVGELKAEVSEINPELASLLFDEKSYNVAGLLGKHAAFKSNREGAVGIGPTVNSLLQWAFLSKKYNGKEIKPISFNGKEFSTYIGSLSSDGKRKGFVLSTLITAMVDNAKERMADRLGLGIEALGIVGHMVALGVDLKTAVVFVNQPISKAFFKELAGNKSLFGTISSRISILRSLNSEQESKLDSESLKSLREEIAAGVDLSTKELMDNIATSGDNVTLNIKTLHVLAEQVKMSEYFSALSDVVKLVKGFKPDMESFKKIRESLDLLSSEGSPYDMEKLLEGTMYGAVVGIYEKMEKIVSSSLITNSPLFKQIINVLNSSVSLSGANEKDFKELSEKALLSFLTLKALMRSGKISPTLRMALNNGIIYNNEEPGSSVIDSLIKLRSQFPDNYFVQNYLVAKPIGNKANKSGIDLIESNNWTKLNEIQRNKIQLSLLELASDPRSRKHFDRLLAYLMVKDGFQFKSGSFLNIVPPVLFTSYFDSSRVFANAIKSGNPSSIEAFFGQSFTEIAEEFVFGFMQSKSAGFYLPYAGKNTSLLQLDSVKRAGNKLIIDVWPKDAKEISEGGELLYDDNGNPYYADEGEAFVIVGDVNNDAKMSVVEEKIEKIKEATKLFRGTRRTLIAKPVIRIGDEVFRLVEVKRFGKDKGFIGYNKKGNLANGIVGNKFVYQLVQLQGSKAQFPVGWSLFGGIPQAATASTNTKAEATNPNYNAKSNVPATANIAPTPAAKEKTTSTGKPIDDLLEYFEVEARFDRNARQFVYTNINTGESYDQYRGESPQNVLSKMQATVQPSQSVQQTGEVTINNTKWTEDSPKENPNTAYVFTENINSIGSTRSGGGSAVIRNNPNAIGIVTKKYYTYSEDRNAGNKEQWNVNFQDTDADFELFKTVNLEQFAKLDQFDSKIFPDSFANSLAAMPNRFALWLQNQLRNRYGLITEVNSKGTGLISKSVEPVQQTKAKSLESLSAETPAVEAVEKSQSSSLLSPEAVLEDWLKTVSDEDKKEFISENIADALKYLIEDYYEYVKLVGSTTPEKFIEYYKNTWC